MRGKPSITGATRVGIVGWSLPYPNSDRVVNISTTSSLRGLNDVVLSDAEYNEFKKQTQTLGKMAAYASAALNLGDCFSYALAKSTREPLLFKGADFTLTDIDRVTIDLHRGSKSP